MRQKEGKSKAKQIDYNIVPDTDFTKRCMNYILVTVKTKRPLTKLLMNAVVQHLKTQGVEYFIDWNGLTLSSFSWEGVSSDKEEKTAVSLGLSEMELKQQKVVVYENDGDLLVLLLARYNNIDCIYIQMKSLAG